MAANEQPDSSSSDQQQVRRRIKAHRKSRAGCYTCKAKKIKCCETRPQCNNCTKGDLQCVFPESKPTAVSVGAGRVQYQSRGFSLRDMRFFHDFMTSSYPHLPLNCDDAWRNDIPILAQQVSDTTRSEVLCMLSDHVQHDFLMHAILALGASHLHAKTNLDLKQTAERHRALAMRGLLDTECEGDSASEDVAGKESRLNAQLATAYALTFTASHLDEPISRFMVLVRGCASLAGHMMRAGYSSPLFPSEGQKCISSEQHVDAMRPRLVDAPPLPYTNDIIEAKQSLCNIANNCSLTLIEWELLDTMQSVVEEIDDAMEAYRNFIRLWDLFTNMSAADFAHFTDPCNVSAVVLQAHFLALEQLMRPWLLRMLPGDRPQRVDDRNSSAALPSCPRPDDEVTVKLMAWPTSFIMRAQQSLS